MSFEADHFRSLARYNTWANRRLYEACGRLGEGEYRKLRAAFFGSLHGTLNHILVGDRVWRSRFQGRPHDITITALDQELYGDFASLRAARDAEDAEIVAFADSLHPADYGRIIRYSNMAGEQHAFPLARLLTHFFNHQTHHRGQAHDQLSQTDVAPPPLDYFYYLRETV